MRITIDINRADDGSTTDPAVTYPPGGGALAAVDDASAAEVARRTGATNAGAAPTGPGSTDMGAEPLGAALGVGTAGTTQSAGSAPTDRG